MFSELLKELRSKKGVTQSQLAKAVGVSPGNVGDWETGKSKPGYSALAELTRYFEVSPARLLEIPAYDQTYTCDGVPLSESEADLIAMCRLIDEADRQTIFELAKLKYELKTGEKVSSYLTYPDVIERQKSAPGDGGKAAGGNA